MRIGRFTAALGAVTLAFVASVAAAGTSDEPSPQDYIDEAFAHLKRHHINRNTADWEALRSAAQTLTKDAQTPAETHAALRAVITALGEKHSYLVPPRRPTASGSPAGSGATVPPKPPMPGGEALGSGIAYITLPYLTTIQGRQALGEQYRDTLRSTLVGLDQNASCGWIIDLRKNPGGNMWPMLNGLDPLLGEGPFGYFVGIEDRTPWVRTANGIRSTQETQAEKAEPSFALENASRPIAVLIGNRTTSSGEMVAVALMSLASARSFGQPTANFTTAVIPFELSDGAVLGVTSSKIAFASGKVVEGALQPDVVAGEDAQEQAVEWLSDTCGAERG